MFMYGFKTKSQGKPNHIPETFRPCYKMIYVLFVFRKKNSNMKYALKHYKLKLSNTLRKQLSFNIRFAVINMQVNSFTPK